MTATPRTDSMILGRCLDEEVVQADFSRSLERELAAAQQDAERAFKRIEQALLPDPHDEREISVDWLRQEIHAAIDAAKGAENE